MEEAGGVQVRRWRETWQWRAVSPCHTHMPALLHGKMLYLCQYYWFNSQHININMLNSRVHKSCIFNNFNFTDSVNFFYQKLYIWLCYYLNWEYEIYIDIISIIIPINIFFPLVLCLLVHSLINLIKTSLASSLIELLVAFDLRNLPNQITHLGNTPRLIWRHFAN